MMHADPTVGRNSGHRHSFDRFRPTPFIAVLVLLAALASVLLPAVPGSPGRSAAFATGETSTTTVPGAGGAANPTTGTLTWSVRPTPTAEQPERPNFVFDEDPGATVRDSVRVRNFGDAPLTFSVYAADAFTTHSGTLDLLTAGKKSKDAGAWIAVSVDTIIVGPKAFVDVPFTLTVPDDATPGDHTAGIVTSLKTDGVSADGSPVQVDRRLGSRVYVRVGGPLKPSLAVTKLSANYDGTLNPFGSGTVDVTYTMKNTGNVRVKAKQAVEVEGVLGLTSTSAAFADMPELLPGDSLTFVARVPDVAPAFSLNVTVKATPYVSRAGDEFEVKPATASRTESALAVPWTFLVLLLVIGVVVATIVTQRRRSRRTMAKKVAAAVAAALAAHGEGVSVSAGATGPTPYEATDTLPSRKR